jgi:hypothetical protein
MASPEEVGEIFNRRVSHLLRDYDELRLAVHQKRRQASLETILAEQTAMSLAVFWESFLHDLMIAHIVRRPEPCLKDYEDRVHKIVSEKLPGALKWIGVGFPDTPSLAQLERLLDPKGWNIVPGSASLMSKFANRLLHASDARKFSLNADDAAFIDYLIAVRNFLGHRSAGARRTLLEAMSTIKPNSGNADLHGPITQVGAYLKQHTQMGTRVNTIGARVTDIATTLSA